LIEQSNTTIVKIVLTPEQRRKIKEGTGMEVSEVEIEVPQEGLEERKGSSPGS
jgi:hypothetical protein